MASETWVLTDAAQSLHEEDFENREVSEGQDFSLSRRTLRGGKREGVDTIEVDNGTFRFVVVPTRGMGLWRGWLDKTEVGWHSPVKGPVHPNYVPLNEPSGLGWLEGFDELLCRCGLVSNGAPELGPGGGYQYPLHGRIANLPAHHVAASVEGDELSITGVVDETRFLFQKLRLTATYKTRLGQKGVTIVDEVTNLSGDPAEMQLLYHINFGPPVIESGARVAAPVKTIVPRDPRAAEGVETWESYQAPQAGFAEQVYFFKLLAGDDGRTHVLLKDAHSSRGVSLRYDTRQLPCFTLWKNTPLEPDGYVTGLEPGTNYPNSRSFEGEQGRVVKLGPGEKVKFELELEVHDDAETVSAAEQQIAALAEGTVPEVFPKPQPGWTQT